MFKIASPVEVLTAMKVFCCSFYGYMLWDLGGPGATQNYSAWSTVVKLTWEVPRSTRTYLMQQVLSSGLCSARVDILTRFEVTVMANLIGYDLRSTTGSNLRFLQECCKVDPIAISSAKLKEVLLQNETAEIPPHATWRLQYLASLLEQRQVARYFSQEEKEIELSNLIDSLCMN